MGACIEPRLLVYWLDSMEGIDALSRSGDSLHLSPFLRERRYEAQIRPRSGLALEHGIVLPNAPGTIDSDYRGEVKIILLNTGEKAFTVKRGDRIAQLVVAPVTRAAFEEVETLPDSARGRGGFGHSGRGAGGEAP